MFKILQKFRYGVKPLVLVSVIKTMYLYSSI